MIPPIPHVSIETSSLSIRELLLEYILIIFIKKMKCDLKKIGDSPPFLMNEVVNKQNNLLSFRDYAPTCSPMIRHYYQVIGLKQHLELTETVIR